MTTDDFETAARAEAEQKWPYSANPDPTPAEDEDAALNAGFIAGAEWAREQEPTDAEVEAVAVLLYRQRAPHHTMESWGREPEPVKNRHRLDARAALVTARDTRAARRDEEKR